jgi:hypothetical protein
MTRKNTPQPLTLGNTSVVDDDHHDFIDCPRTPLSLKSPKSPKSPPFRFNRSKKPQSDFAFEAPSMQAAEQNQPPSNLPPSEPSSSFQQYPAAGQENQERPAKTGFFSNYKAAKSSSRLQNSESAQPVTEDNMSRDTERPGMAGKVSIKETRRAGTTHAVSSLLSRCHSLT